MPTTNPTSAVEAGEQPMASGDHADQEGGQCGRALHSEQGQAVRRQRAEVLTDDVAERAGQVGGGLLGSGDRSGRVDDRGRVDEHRRGRQRDEEVAVDGRGDDEGRPVLHSPHAQQDQADQRVDAEDVPGDQEDAVQAADREEAAQSPQHSRLERGAGPLRRLQLQLEAVAEQEREQQVELHVHERGRHPVHGVVEPRGVRRILREVDREAGGGERDVHDQDAQQGETTQRVDVLNPRPIEYLAHAAKHISAARRAQSG